jgi:SAM-dependent methyltransferase
MKSISLYEFGNSEDVVREIQARFVQFFLKSAPVLDIGCGRGIFLELLAKAGIEAVGIDHSEESISACQQKGFTAHLEDARTYLQANTGRFGGIFCSHVIEHMSYDDAMGLLALCHRALRLGGSVVLITPNPEDIAVITNIFWLDPTHVRPYPLELLEAMFRANKFRVKTSGHYLGSLREIGLRNLPAYFLRRMLLGKYYGKSSTFVFAETTSADNPTKIEKANSRPQ